MGKRLSQYKSLLVVPRIEHRLKDQKKNAPGDLELSAKKELAMTAKPWTLEAQAFNREFPGRCT